MKIGFLTSGGNAPCLSSSIGRLLYKYSQLNEKVEAFGYINGFSGLLRGNKVSLPTNLSEEEYNSFYRYGGSLIGNSRVKLTNKEDCIKRELIRSKDIPLQVAAEQLIKDEIDILHPIGGDDTNTTARDLLDYIQSNGSNINVIGIPKTIDNDIYPVLQSLGAITAAEETSNFFSNIVSENNMSCRHLLIHEVMGRNCGWLTAYSAKKYHEKITQKQRNTEDFFDYNRHKIHAIYIPEIEVDLDKEAIRLNKVMNDIGCVNIFVSEGSFISESTRKLESFGENIQKDAFGHLKLDSVEIGKRLSQFLSGKINFDRCLIQKSGYFSRSAPPNSEDLKLILEICDYGFNQAINGENGLVGYDERTGTLNCIKFQDIQGNRSLNVKSQWVINLINEIGMNN